MYLAFLMLLQYYSKTQLCHNTQMPSKGKQTNKVYSNAVGKNYP